MGEYLKLLKLSYSMWIKSMIHRARFSKLKFLIPQLASHVSWAQYLEIFTHISACAEDKNCGSTCSPRHPEFLRTRPAECFLSNDHVIKSHHDSEVIQGAGSHCGLRKCRNEPSANPGTRARSLRSHRSPHECLCPPSLCERSQLDIFLQGSTSGARQTFPQPSQSPTPQEVFLLSWSPKLLGKMRQTRTQKPKNKRA